MAPPVELVRRAAGRRAWRWGGAALLAAIAAFHLSLLAARLRDATLGEPAVALRWLLSAALLVATRRLLRRPAGGGRDRAGLVLLLILVLLHVAGPPAPDAGVLGLLVALPAGVAAVGCATGAVATAVAAIAPAVASRRTPPARRRQPGGVALGRLASRFVPRPPPPALAAA